MALNHQRAIEDAPCPFAALANGPLSCSLCLYEVVLYYIIMDVSLKLAKKPYCIRLLLVSIVITCYFLGLIIVI
jgi:hypothetical protein